MDIQIMSTRLSGRSVGAPSKGRKILRGKKPEPVEAPPPPPPRPPSPDPEAKEEKVEESAEEKVGPL
jgi:hypothetical protein